MGGKEVDSGEDLQDALKEMFDRIQSVTPEESLDLLPTSFIQGESFRLINSQKPEILKYFWSH